MRKLVQHKQAEALTLSKDLFFLQLYRDNSGSPGPLHISFKKILHSDNNQNPILCPIQFPMAPFSLGVPFVPLSSKEQSQILKQRDSRSKAEMRKTLGESGCVDLSFTKASPRSNRKSQTG